MIAMLPRRIQSLILIIYRISKRFGGVERRGISGPPRQLRGLTNNPDQVWPNLHGGKKYDFFLANMCDSASGPTKGRPECCVHGPEQPSPAARVPVFTCSCVCPYAVPHSPRSILVWLATPLEHGFSPHTDARENDSKVTVFNTRPWVRLHYWLYL